MARLAQDAGAELSRDEADAESETPPASVGGGTRGYQGTQAEREQIADALEAIAAVQIRYVCVATALRAYFGTDTGHEGWAQFDRWVKTSQPDAALDTDYGVDPPTPAQAWAEGLSNPSRDPTSVLPKGTRPVFLSVLLFELRRLAKDNGPIRAWPDTEKKLIQGFDGGKISVQRPSGKSRANVAWLLDRIKVVVYWDDFARDFMIDGFKNYQRLDDHVVRSLWFKAQALGLSTDRDFFTDALKDIAMANRRHPLQAYLAKVEVNYRERVKRVGEPKAGKALIETLLIKYAGAEDTPLNRAFVRKWLIAAVRRARKPGTKFDQMLVLESAEGMGKSMLPRRLASADWFEENLSFGATARQMIQQTANKWVVEMAELVGIGVKEIEAIKQQLSRTTDRADLKYDKFATDAPRHFVFIGTTNDAQYLRSKTGNRRFWPIKITREIDEGKIAAIRDHLWGEAAYFEAEGESIELPRDLWADATEAQKGREAPDPLVEMLEPHLSEQYGQVTLDAVWALAGYAADSTDRKKQSVRTQLGLAMMQLGWEYKRKTKVYERTDPLGETWTFIDVGTGGRIDYRGAVLQKAGKPRKPPAGPGPRE